MKTLSLFLLCIYLCGCGGRGGHTIDPGRQGIPGKSLDTIATRIEKHTQGDDRIGVGQDVGVSVYLMPMMDDDGRLSDEGLVTLKGAGL